ncbi:hypothetical protein FOZ63_003448, partial [Perkinsus olseni]
GIEYVNYQLSREHQRRAKEYIRKWDASLKNPFIHKQAGRRAPVPQSLWPLSYSSAVRVMLLDFLQQKPYLLRELATVVSSSSIAIDYQRKISKRVTESRVLGQAMTCVGEHSMILTTVIVPTTRCEYLKDALLEVYERHVRAGGERPPVLYTDVGCCAASGDGSGTLQKYVPQGVQICLDAMHCIMRMVRATDQSHLLKNKFAKDISKAFFICNLEDEKALRSARVALDLPRKIPKSERLKFIRRSVPDGKQLDARVERVVRTYHSVDESMKREWEEECATKSSSTPNEQVGDKISGLLIKANVSTFWEAVCQIPLRAMLKIRLGMRLPDVHQTPREIELMGDAARELYPDFRLVPRDAPLPTLGFEYCASLNEVPPEEAVLSRESPWISDRVEMLHEIVNDERDATADSESEGFKSILEGELGDADAAGKEGGESDCDDSTDSEEEIDHVASLDPLPVATQRRKFLRWRTKAQSASYFRVDHEVGGAMERAFTTLHVDNPTATAPELLKLYTRDYLMKERANHEIDGRRPISYHPT